MDPPPATPSRRGPALVALLALVRPWNALITALSVAVGALTGGLPLGSAPVFWAALGAALITGAGNALNDWVDVATDRINRPERPLPAGRLSRRAALIEAMVLAGGGLAAAAAASIWHLWVGVAVLAGLAAYDLRLKATVLWGNLAVAALAAAAFPYGALGPHWPGRSWAAAVFAGVFHFGREIVKDLEDTAGDHACGLRTLPLARGRRAAARWAAVAFLCLAAATWYPWFSNTYGGAYLAAVLPVNALLVVAAGLLLRGLGPAGSGILARWLKPGMLLGLLAIVVGELCR